MELTIKTLHGLEECLANEVRALGGTEVKVLKRAVSCEGNLAYVYRANYLLRTALRVLVPVVTIRARNEAEFYAKLRNVHWDEHLELRQTFAIDHSIAKNATLKHSMFASLKLKDAITDYFRDKTGKRPSVNPDNPGVLFNLHGSGDTYTVSIDSSGKPLNQRGYRKQGHQAPLNEVLAAGLVQMSGWDGQKPFLDPMCGSGTIALEAAMWAQQMPAQVLRSDFGFMNWTNFNAILWNKVKAEAQAEQRKPAYHIYASDISADAVKLVKSSAGKLKLGKGFEISQRDFLKMRAPTASGVIVTNPPYGERIGGDQMNEMYQRIGDVLKQQFTGWDAWLLSSNFAALRALRLRPSDKHVLFNGALECQFCRYSLFEGSED